jgi:hypothetical protein
MKGVHNGLLNGLKIAYFRFKILINLGGKIVSKHRRVDEVGERERCKRCFGIK